MNVSKLTAFWFTPDSEKRKKKPTRFKIKPLSAAKFYEVADDCELVSGNPRPNKTARELLWIEGIVDWENFKDGKEVVPFSSDNFELIPFVTLQELTREIFTVSSLSGAEIKN